MSAEPVSEEFFPTCELGHMGTSSNVNDVAATYPGEGSQDECDGWSTTGDTVHYADECDGWSHLVIQCITLMRCMLSSLLVRWTPSLWTSLHMKLIWCPVLTTGRSLQQLVDTRELQVGFRFPGQLTVSCATLTL